MSRRCGGRAAGGAARRVFGPQDPSEDRRQRGGRPADGDRPLSAAGEHLRAAGLRRRRRDRAVPDARRQFRIDKTNALWIPVKPRAGVSVSDAQEAVTMALREMRHLRPSEPNTFDLMTQDQILDVFNSSPACSSS
jgi:hypothetical protein